MLRQPIITVLGHVDHGKCVTPETKLVLADNRILTAQELYEGYANQGTSKKLDEYLVTEIENGPEVFSLEKAGVAKKKITHLWKIKSPERLVRIRLKSGDVIDTTFEHPFFVLDNTGKITPVRAQNIKSGDFIVVPQKLDFTSDLTKTKENLFSNIEKATDFVVFVDNECLLMQRLEKEDIYALKREGLFSTDPYTCIKNSRFKAKDFARLCRLFGFGRKEAYDMIKYIKNSSSKWRAGHTSTRMRLPKTEEDFVKLGYVLGCIAGDGYVKGGILNNNDFGVQRIYQNYVNEIFELESQVVQGHTCQIVRTNGGLTFVRFLIDIIGFPSSEKSSTIEIPHSIYPHFEVIAAFLRGWFDTDGYVSHINHTIEITSKSKKLVKQASVFLLGKGVHSSVFTKNGFWYLRIGNRPYLERFMIHIGSNCEFKKNRILEALSKTSTSRIFDITPLSGSILSEIKIGDANRKIAYFTKYKTYQNLSRRFLQDVSGIFKKSELNKFGHILSNDISFVRVVSKETIVSGTDFVYDFTVADSHNFVAERMFIHNTTLLDRIRQTVLAAKEAGGITQAIGTTEIPLETVKSISGQILHRFGFEVSIPGLLFIDTPGHEAFVSLRRRGGSIADLAILVIDIIEGIMPQTEESIQILKDTRTPFVVALNKIDRIQGWHTHEQSFLKNYEMQLDITKEVFEERFYNIVSQLSHHDFDSERFDRVQDFKKTVTIVPISGKTGEGVPELLAILTGLAQQFLKLEKTDQSAGMILDVKEVTGLGTTIDCIVYDGKIAKNDFLIICNPPMIAKIRALLVPEPLRDMRTEKKFRSVEEVSAAVGVKISAPGLDTVIAGSQIRTAKSFEEAEALLNELEKEREEVEIVTEGEGLILKANTLGSLEALKNIFKNHPIKEATIGNITKRDVISAEANAESANRIVIGFNVAFSEDAQQLAGDKKIKLLTANVIYHLIENYEKWALEEKEALKKKELEAVTRPGKLLILPGCVFRASNPAIVGCEVVSGIVKPGYSLFKEDRLVGEIKQIQSQGKNIAEAKIGDKVAISISGPTVGRQIDEPDVLYTELTGEDYKKLKKFEQLITEHEIKTLEEIKEIKRKYDPKWGL